MSRPRFKEDDEQLISHLHDWGVNAKNILLQLLIPQGSNVTKLQVFPNLRGKCCLKQII